MLFVRFKLVFRTLTPPQGLIVITKNKQDSADIKNYLLKQGWTVTEGLLDQSKSYAEEVEQHLTSVRQSVTAPINAPFVTITQKLNGD